MADWLTTKEAAELTGYTTDHIRKMASAGKLKAQRWGRDWQIERRSLLAHVKAVAKLGRKRGRKSQ